MSLLNRERAQREVRAVFTPTASLLEAISMPSADHQSIELIAQNLAGYIETQSGRNVAFAVILNDMGVISSIEEVVEVMPDQGAITNQIYESL
jgi:D-alanyl-D-alanine carboxypeptidase